MSKNRLANSLAMLMAAASLILGCSATAYAAEQTFETKAQFETTDRQEDGYAHFPLAMEKDGKSYSLKSIKTEIIKEELVQRDMITLEGEGFTGEPENHRPPETIEKEGKVYQLKETSLLDITLEERSKDISAVIPYEGVEYIDTLPDMGDLEVMDEDTGQRMDARLPYKSHKEIRSYWDNGFSFPITVVAYDAETYRLGDVEIPKDTDLLLYGREFLRYLGLPEDYYRILDVQWEGESYESNGEIRRDAKATGQKMVKDMEVTYAGTVTFEGIKAQAYNSVYELVPKEGQADTIYTVEAIAAYIQKTSAKGVISDSLWKDLLDWIKVHPLLATICLALILLVFWFIAFLFTLTRRRKKEKKSVEIRIHEEDEEEEEDDRL